jgi:hypothetical protein
MPSRGYTSYPSSEFGAGLNLADKPDAISPAECIDCMDVTFTDRGAIEQRAGSAAWSAALTNRPEALEPFYTSGSTKQLLAGCGTRLEALEAGGAVKASATGLSGGPWDFARFGKPNEEVAYAGNGTDTIRKWSGAAWSAPTATVDGTAARAMPKARYLAVLAAGNRLVATGYSTTTGGPNAATSSPSHVWFSEEGNPEAWMAEGTETHPNNSEELTPGDGEAIQGAIAWGEFVFVFKESKFFVFYGVSTDAGGNPIFNYRTVDTGVGCVAPRTICADASGVYFMGRNGVYRTAGQAPQLLSQRVEPIWSGDASPFFTGGTLAHGSIANCAATIHGSRLYLSYPTSTSNNRTLVYDPERLWWSLASFPAAALASFRVSSAPELAFAYASGENRVARHSSSYTNDAGSAISSYWRSGWFDLDNPDVKTIRASKVWGTGRVGMGLDHDFTIQPAGVAELDMSGSTGSTEGGTGLLGGEGFLGDTASDLVVAHRRVAVRGTVFSVYFTNSALDQPWSMHRVDHMVRETRKPSTLNA